METNSFQRLVQSLQSGEQEDQTYEILLESAVNSVGADAAWLEIKDDSGTIHAQRYHRIDTSTARRIKRLLRKRRLDSILDNTFARNKKEGKDQEGISQFDYGSVFVAPLLSNEKSIGSLTLLKKISNGFDDEQKELINTFARQASISIDNYRLLSKTIEAERLKEEMKIFSRMPKRPFIKGFFRQLS